MTHLVSNKLSLPLHVIVPQQTKPPTERICGGTNLSDTMITTVENPDPYTISWIAAIALERATATTHPLDAHPLDAHPLDAHPLDANLQNNLSICEPYLRARRLRANEYLWLYAKLTEYIDHAMSDQTTNTNPDSIAMNNLRTCKEKIQAATTTLEGYLQQTGSNARLNEEQRILRHCLHRTGQANSRSSTNSHDGSWASDPPPTDQMARPSNRDRCQSDDAMDRVSQTITFTPPLAQPGRSRNNTNSPNTAQLDSVGGVNQVSDTRMADGKEARQTLRTDVVSKSTPPTKVCSSNGVAASTYNHMQENLAAGSHATNDTPIPVRSHDVNALSPCTEGLYCASKLERDGQRRAYIKSIRKEDVFKLASSYNVGRDCYEFREPEHGSFNVCFFVEFPSDGKQWVVRFPICPVLHEPWRKLQSEIATMECVISCCLRASALTAFLGIFKIERQSAYRTYTVTARVVGLTQATTPVIHM